MNTRKAVLAAALVMATGAPAVEAASYTPLYFSGSFTMLAPNGDVVGSIPVSDFNFMSWDYGTATGTANFHSSQTFFGYFWTAHDITMQAIARDVVRADMLFDWSVSSNIPVRMDLSMTPAAGGYLVGTLDGNAPNWTPSQPDGVPGYPMTTGPWMDFNWTLSGFARTCILDTPEGDPCPESGGPVPPHIAPVPLPTAVWLLISGLAGLAGMVRRRRAAGI